MTASPATGSMRWLFLRELATARCLNQRRMRLWINKASRLGALTPWCKEGGSRGADIGDG